MGSRFGGGERSAEKKSRGAALVFGVIGNGTAGNRFQFLYWHNWPGHLQERKKETLKKNPGVLHSFSGSLETAQRAIGSNFYIGITGPVTFKNSKQKQEMVAQLPLEKLLIETDAPYLTPHPHRGKRNEPAFVSEIADKIAGLQSRNQEEVAAATTINAARLFSWGEDV